MSDLERLQFETELKRLYDVILQHHNKSEIDLVDSTLGAIEENKKRWLPQVPAGEVRALTLAMPDRIQSALASGYVATSERPNCINAALNFHDKKEFRLKAYKPVELLSYLMEGTTQLHSPDDFKFGDLVVFWNRNDSKWVHSPIRMDQINFEDPDFPYGLVFDHVAVRVKPDVVFNKPNPSPASPYRFDYLETASYPARLGMGFQMTFHRLKN